MRILHVTDTYAPTLGGIEIFVHDLAHRQGAQGHDVTVLTRTPADVGGGARASVVRVVRDPGASRLLVAEADAVHVHASALSPLALAVAEDAARCGTPVLATVHSMWTDVWPLARLVGAFRGWSTLPIQWAAVSAVAAEPVRRALRRPVLVLPNAVDATSWEPGGRTGPGPVTVVSVLRMVRRKRPLQLVSVLAQARRLVPAGTPMRAVLVGDGPLLGAARRAVRRSGLDWVELVGAMTREEIAGVFQKGDVFVAPATMESFGITALEARTAGLAVLARNGTGVEEFIRHDVDGFLLGGDAAMAGALARLCNEPATLERIRAHNIRHRPGFECSDALSDHDLAYLAAARLTAQAPGNAGIPSGQPAVGLRGLVLES